MTIVCGDSHTATHGAFGTGLGIGTPKLNTYWQQQTLKTAVRRPAKIEVQACRALAAKDIVLAIIGKLAAQAAPGNMVELCGEAT